MAERQKTPRPYRKSLAFAAEEIVVHHVYRERLPNGKMATMCEARINVYFEDGSCWGTVATLDLEKVADDVSSPASPE
jgi:hypothetical protein